MSIMTSTPTKNGYRKWQKVIHIRRELIKEHDEVVVVHLEFSINTTQGWNIFYKPTRPE